MTENKHWGCTGALIIDARIKPHHAPVLEIDPKTKEKVDQLFSSAALSLKTMPPHISILTPVKNAEKYLQQCLDSILVQSHEDFELILVNDHSTDRSLEIMQYYALQDARVHVHNNTGNGIIDALRLAFSESQGQYITRMDADDKMHPQKLELMSAKLKEKGRGALAVGLVEYFSAAGIGDGYKRYSQWLNALTSTETNFTDIYRECVIPSPCWMIDREDLIACEAFQPNRYPEDYDLCFRF